MGSSSHGAGSFNARAILEQLDQCAKDFEFPMMDNGYVNLVDSRLSTYRDDQRWAMVIEIVGYNFRAGVPNGMDVVLYCFGNCLSRPPGTADEDFLRFVHEVPETDLDEEEEAFKPSATTIRVRDQVIPIPKDPATWKSKGIDLESPPGIQPYELMRVLIPEHRDLFLATEEELRKRVPPDIPLFIRLNDWHHPDLANDELPSKSRTFQTLAEALSAGDRAKYRPTTPSNTHWSNWPESGAL